MNAIQVKNVTKRYKNVLALNDISLEFEHGKIYGFLGRNGAGKTSLINIISNRIFASEGVVLIDGLPAKENMQIHEKIFCMSESDLYDESLKVKDLFKWIGRFYTCFDREKAFEIAEKFSLDVNKKFKQLSKGYKSIFKLTVALSLELPYLVFDEPVLGLDANHRELFYKLLLQKYENEENTIIVATHLIEEVANLIEEVILIDKGQLLLQEKVESLLQKGYSISGSVQEVDAYCKQKNVVGYDELGGLKVAYILDEDARLPQDSKLQMGAMNLQKLFVKITEKGGERHD